MITPAPEVTKSSWNLLRSQSIKGDQIIESRPWQPDARGSMTMRNGDIYTVGVTNLQKDGKPVFVTVLVIYPNMKIEVILPDQGGEPKKLEAGEQSIGAGLICDESDLGTSHAVVLVTREPVNYSFVQQDALPTTRGGTRQGGAGPLGQLLQERTFFTPPATRGTRLRSTSDTTWHSQVIAWHAVP